MAAGALFADVGMSYVSEDPPLSIEELERYRSRGMAWVAAEPLAEQLLERLAEPPVEQLVEQPVEQLTDRPVAYLLVDLVDGNAHIEQVSVHPEWGRQGIGRALICHLEGWAAGQGLTAVTLTTFADVPWNGPYYRRCGFRPMTEAELGPELAALRATERSPGSGPAPSAGHGQDPDRKAAAVGTLTWDEAAIRGPGFKWQPRSGTTRSPGPPGPVRRRPAGRGPSGGRP